MTERETAFLKALAGKTPDFEKAEAWLRQGVDINAKDAMGSLLGQYLSFYYDESPECNNCEKDFCRDCEFAGTGTILPVVEFFIANGWDSLSDGLHCVAKLVHTTHDKQMFYAARRIMECPLPEERQAYEGVLECIGTEESYQRCCEECHEQENLYYAMYELVEARMNGKPFGGIHPFYDAVGKRVDKVVSFSEKSDFRSTERGIEFDHDLGLICGELALVIRSDVNVLFMNDRINESPQTDVSETFADGVIGATVTEITFGHRNLSEGKTIYGQPLIRIRFDSGRELCVTHNFGELPDRCLQARFWLSSSLE